MQKKTFLDILLFVLFVVGGLLFSQFLALVTLLPFHEDLPSLMAKLNAPLQHPEMRMQLLSFQGISAFCSFVLAPWIFLQWKEGAVCTFLYPYRWNYHFIWIGVLLPLVSTPFTSLIIEWNESIHLPSSLSWLENWARHQEDYLKEITHMLTHLTGLIELSGGLVVIAFLPALGEELVFRGFLQNKLQQLFQRRHLAIWTSAFLFSAIHFQFFGFVPRMVLGAMFGYLYSYSGQFHLPVLAHFTNNGMMLVLIYLRNQGTIAYDIEKEDQVPYSLVIVSLLLTISLMYLFIQAFKRKDLSDSGQ
jgi:membrane protease YdiL (CAAX protease family)